MKKNYSLNDIDIKKYYLVRKPTRLSDLDTDEFYKDDEFTGWRDKARQLQIRRWRKLRHQIA
jgi:hypothetical protein